MTAEKNIKGICCTCLYRSNCLSLENSIRQAKVIVCCHEFNDGTSQSNVIKEQRNPALFHKSGSNAEMEPKHSSSGICINCDDNEICGFSCNGEKVIFCEEYK